MYIFSVFSAILQRFQQKNKKIKKYFFWHFFCSKKTIFCLHFYGGMIF